jgi:GNAT superfamily N-acetyltransferase
MTYTLRPATREDLEPMMAIGHEGIRPYVEALGEWSQDEQERGFREHFVPESVSIVQVVGRDAGYVQVEEHADHRFLAGLYLRSEARGQGTGTALVLDLIRRTRSDARPLRLRVLRANPAQHLYERLGFRRTGATATHIHMEMDPITIARADLTSDEGRALIGALNAELGALYSEPGANHFALDPEEVSAGRGVFFVAYRDGSPVGCGALRRLDAGTAELKRMYVAPLARGSGLGRRLVDALEAEARALGVRRLVLETGVRQAAALALYRATGFEPIPLYGEYRLSPDTSVCLGKDVPLRRGSAGDPRGSDP